ncbi:MAG: NAD-dependent succinate-semialdehyde dehydrogenase [Bacteroidota bacterium]
MSGIQETGLSPNKLFKVKSYVNGSWLEGAQKFPVHNPFDGSLIAEVSDLGRDETRSAIEAAQSAFALWRAYSANKRSKILKNWFRLQLENASELAQILTLEQGKPLAEAIGEIKYGASYVEWFAEEAKRVYGDVIPGQTSKHRITVIKQPIGVVGAITPWNFPSAMITRKVAPALAAGCTVVIKPSELTPLSALSLAQLAEEAGFPPGVFNVVTSNRPSEVGLELTTNSLVKKISFTGSTAVGKLLLKQSADQVKKVSLELGGNAPFIVFEDADVDDAVKGLMASKFRNTGQTCVCSNRIFVHESLEDEFKSKLGEAMQSLKLGNGLDEGVNIGPMIEEAAVHKVNELIDDAKNRGAEVLIGGKPSSQNDLIFEPTVLTKVNPKMRIFKEEIFGPVVPIYSFTSVDEVIEAANDTNYGLAAYFFGRDYSRIWKVAEELDFGMVGINTGIVSNVAAPFGGVKESGFGREGSKYGIEDYLNIKYMCWAGVE